MPDKDYFMERYRRIMKEAKVKLGGTCNHCGCDDLDDLEFDHIDPLTKVDAISNLATGSKEAFDKELGKCQLLCNSCHAEKTAEYLSEVKTKPIKHGTVWAYNGRGCRCEKCRQAKRESR
jgi:5-methylcytosine-specific restriction endonuclease McrA